MSCRAWLAILSGVSGTLLTAAAAQAQLPVPAYVTAQGKGQDPFILAGYLPADFYDGWTGNPVDPTGTLDSTVAIQKAIQDGYDNALAVYLPPGTYLVSDTLEGRQIGQVSDCAEHVGFTAAGSIRKAPVLVGPADGPHPLLRLQDGSPGFADPGSPKAVLHFRNYFVQTGATDWMGAADCAMGLVIRGIDVDVGSGNPGAVGIQIPSAQYSTLEDVHVEATGGYAGIRGAVTTNVMVNLEVDGGQYGLIADTCCGISIAGLALSQQTVAGLWAHTYGSVTVAGFSIAESSAAAVLTDAGCGQTDALTLYDGSIVVAGTVPAVSNSGACDLYLGDVYVQAGGPLVRNGTSNDLLGGAGWNLVSEYAYTEPGSATQSDGTAVESYTLVDGVSSKAEIARVGPAPTAPPADLVARHVWQRIPWFADSGVVNVRAAPYGATGDGSTDDTTAIQQAIDASAKVFLPRGDYVISRPLLLHQDTVLMGVPGLRARVRAPSWVPAASFQYFVQTDGDAEATTYVGDLLLSLPGGSYDKSYLGGMDWRAGRRSLVRQVAAEIEWEDLSPPSAARKTLRIRDSGGGRFYGYTNIAQWRSSNPDYRPVLVDGTREPLTFYGPNLEHGGGDFQVEILNAQNVRIFGTKTETSSYAHIADSANLFFGSLTGNGSGRMTFDRVQNMLAPNLTIYASNHHASQSAPFLTEHASDGGTYQVAGKDNCSLFVRGLFDPTPFVPTAAACGDGTCAVSEACSTCPQDCGPCVTESPATACHAASPLVLGGDAAQWDTATRIVIPYTRSMPVSVAPELATSQADCSAVAKVTWDAQALYVRVEVTDDHVIDDSTALYNDDGVELYLDGGHERAATYDANDFQLTVTADNRADPTKEAATGFTHATTTTTFGYVVEYAVPFAVLTPTPGDGTVVGFDLAVNDDDTGGNARQSQLMWHGDGTEYLDPRQLGDLVLSTAPCVATSDDGAPTDDGGPASDGAAGDAKAQSDTGLSGGDAATVPLIGKSAGCSCSSAVGPGGSGLALLVAFSSLRRRSRATRHR